MSLLFYYRTIFKVGRQIIFSVASIGLIGLVAIWMIVYFFGLMFTCGTRIDANWTSLPMNAEYCWFTFGSPAMIGWLLSWSWTDFIMDLFVLLFPIPMVSSSASVVYCPRAHLLPDHAPPDVPAAKAVDTRHLFFRRSVCRSTTQVNRQELNKSPDP